MTSFDVDVDALQDLLTRMLACQRELGDLARDVDDAVTQLHEHWHGVASTAHTGRHIAWRGEYADMVTALAGLRTCVAGAVDNYSSAARANVAMWRQLA